MAATPAVDMTGDPIAAATAIAAQDASAITSIAEANTAAWVWTVVLDDDPTGTQSITALPVLTPGFTDADLAWAAGEPGRTTFVLTNSRSHDTATAEHLTTDTVRRASAIAQKQDLTIRVVSRSDSTLRGHFATEITAAHRALRSAGHRTHGTVFVPAFLEAGRVTVDNIQWVKTPSGFTPAARTEFAKDTTFGYTEENLLRWVQGRMGTSAPAPTSVSIDDLRAPDGVERVSAAIAALDPDGVLIANAAHPGDLEVLMRGLLEQEHEGRRPVIRSGPSFVRLCAGQQSAQPLTRAEVAATDHHGLVVVGSHTALTNAQFAAATAAHELHLVELDAASVLDGDQEVGTAEIRRCVDEIVTALDAGDVAVRTSRTVLTRGRATPLLTSNAVADALVDTVARVAQARQLGFLVAKGGITSSDMAVRALATHRARVLGQMLPGTIPVWELLDGRSPGLTYVVFPGNVGADDALTAVLTTLRSADA